MKLSPQTERRPGFTLVEMLIVLAIIIVLVSLVAGAVLQFIGVGPRMVAQHEISNLNQAVEQFKAKYSIYPPSKIFLANTQPDYQTAKANDPANAAFYDSSWAIINRIFPKLDWLNTSGNGTIDWTGGQFPLTGTNRWKGTYLEGDQCLVFFLGGMQTSAGGVNQCIGFAANSKNPTLMPSATFQPPRYDPLYDFPPTRLAALGTTPVLPTRYSSPYNQNNFFIYIDPFNPVNSGMPYIYFSSNGGRNNYTNDCPSIPSNPTSSPPTLGVSPYYETAPNVVPIRFLNPNTFQIISAGADGVFGVGGYWNPPQALDLGWPDSNHPLPTKDNQSNFNNGGLMGTRS